MRIWGRVALGGIFGVTSALVIIVPAGASPSHPGGVPDTCPEVLAGAPTGGVEKLTDPADGSEVRAGDVVSVTLRWDTATFTGPVLHKALDCVTVDGNPADELSTQERDTPNDGRFDYRFTVPADLADGVRLCDRGFVSGPDGTGFNREKSNDVCFVVRTDQPMETPPSPEAPPAVPDVELVVPDVTPETEPVPLTITPFAAPIADTNPLPAPVADTTPAPAQSSPINVGPAGEGRPGTEVSPETVVAGLQVATLPRTGPPVEATVRLGAVTLLLGGLCLFAGRRRHDCV